MTISNLPSAEVTPVDPESPEIAKIPTAPPISWYSFGSTNELRSGPVSKRLLDRELVAFRTASGQIAVIEARCVHMGANLGSGCVVGENIKCPFHDWQFDTTGQCVKIPMASDIPAFARQACFPVKQQHGEIYFFNAPKSLFPLPYFAGCQVGDLLPAKPFTIVVECPWYMVGANAVDVQHFSTAHDRRIKGHPVVDFPTPYAHRTRSTFFVEGNSLADRLTRRFAGDEVAMEITSWAGTLVFAQATFRRTRTFGMISLLPLGPRRTLAKVTVFARRSNNRLRHVCIDPISAWVRSKFIKRFLSADVPRMAGTQFNPHTFIETDRLIAEYCDWLASLQGARHV